MMKAAGRPLAGALLGATVLALTELFLQVCAFAQGVGPCPRFAVGSSVTPPEDLFSQGGVLTVNLSYQTTVDQNGNTLFCYMMADGTESPTLHVSPGDQLVLTLTNDTPAPTSSTAVPLQMTDSAPCGDPTMDSSSTNVHFHGTNTSPSCGQDEVIHTLINSGNSFTYTVQFPSDEPPGLYWYHPHVHGIAEAAVQGGASGAIIVEGIQNLQPKVAGLPARLLIIRDNPVPGNPTPGGKAPSWDLSVNFIPVPYPDYTPAIIPMKPKERQLWRVLNASADSILNLKLEYDGVAQPLGVVELDGVPTGSQDGTRKGKVVTEDNILLPPAARAEFIVTGPGKRVKHATLLTANIDTGPDGDDDPTRPLASIQTSDDAPEPPVLPTVLRSPGAQRFEGLAAATPTAKRTLYFSEVLLDPSNPNSPTNFFITVAGQTPTLFSPDNPPAITTTQGSVEDWTIQNRAMENHEFHIHQIHFLLLERNGAPVPAAQQQMFDMVQVPFWKGSGPYPSVKIRLDFRGPDTGDFVYHCHILGHEDAGMMAIIQVLPDSTGARALRTMRSLLASAGLIGGAKPSLWCVNGRIVERGGETGLDRAVRNQAAALGGLIVLTVLSAWLIASRRYRRLADALVGQG